MGPWRGFLAAAAGAAGVAAWPRSAEAHAEKPPNAAAPESEGTLKLVQVVFRHGARTPLSANYWPELVEAWDVCGQLYDPVPVEVVDESGEPRPVNVHDAQQVATKFNGGCHKGELTRVGQHQARTFGRWLRQRYVEDLGFLPAEYDDKLLYSRSTNYSRTIATVTGVLTGLFPGTERHITVKTTEEMDEILFGNPDSCMRLRSIIKRTADLLSSGPLSPPVEELQKQVQAILILPQDARVRFLDLHDAMTTMATHGKTIPAAFSQEPELLEKIEQQAVERFMKFVVGTPGDKGTQEVLRLGMGRLMHLLLQRMEESAKTTEQGIAGQKMFLYSGHDSTIMPLLAALGQDVDHWPVYLSNLVFELWERPNGQHHVKVLYNREDLRLSCGGAEGCKLESLKEQVLKPFLITQGEREAECLVHFSHDLPAGEHVKEVGVGSSVIEA